MHQYEQKRQQKQNFWNESGAVLHETDKRQQFAGTGAGMFAVQENGADRDADSAAAQCAFRKLKGMENAYGSLWFGMTEEKQLKIEVSRRTVCRGDSLRTDQKKLEESRTAELHAGSSGRVGELRGRTDSHQKADSAVVLQASDRLTPERILRDLKRLAKGSGQETLCELLPGLWEQEAPGVENRADRQAAGQKAGETVRTAWEQAAWEIRQDGSRGALHREHLRKVRKHIEDVLEEIRVQKAKPQQAAIFGLHESFAQQAAGEAEKESGEEAENEEEEEPENRRDEFG